MEVSKDRASALQCDRAMNDAEIGACRIGKHARHVLQCDRAMNDAEIPKSGHVLLLRRIASM